MTEYLRVKVCICVYVYVAPEGLAFACHTYDTTNTYEAHNLHLWFHQAGPFYEKKSSYSSHSDSSITIPSQAAVLFSIQLNHY